MANKIRVLVVDDSIIARKIIMEGLRRDPRIEVAGYAINAADAENKLRSLNPDVMTCDVQMPGMTGIEFLKKILPQHPLPVVLASSLNLRVFDALHAGAVGFVRKPDGVQSRDEFVRSLTEAVIEASHAKVRRPAPVGAAAVPELPVPATVGPIGGSTGAQQYIIGLGASTGGTEATLEVMKRLPADIPAMVIVQHMPPGFTKMYAKRLDDQCRLQVKEAETGDRVLPGRMLIAPGGDMHMHLVKVNGAYQVECKKGPRVNGHCPSVDVLFDSVARVAGANALGIILTGMGGDGANGLLAMRKAGARTIGQDESTCVVYGMPKVAYDLGAVQYQEKLFNIAKRTYSLLNNM